MEEERKKKGRRKSDSCVRFRFRFIINFNTSCKIMYTNAIIFILSL